MRSPDCNDGDMETTQVRVRRSVAEKRRIVELTFQPGQSVARVAQAEGVNSHQVFQWRRAYRAGELEGIRPTKPCRQFAGQLVWIEAHCAGVICLSDWMDLQASPDRKSTRLNSSHLGISYA